MVVYIISMDVNVSGVYMEGTLAAILGGAAGAVALVGIVIFLIWFCLSHKKSVSRTSETGSSEPSQGERHVGVELSMREARRFEMEELSVATKNFSDKNLIALGKFGEVYKDSPESTVVFFQSQCCHVKSSRKVRYLSPIQHRNLVTLLGYCQENNQQFLIYEYVPSGSVSSHLYGAGQVLDGKLEFKLRLSIALGAAKGLAHLHSQSPRLLHKDFKTANVLVDENFIAKVADAGLRNFLGRVDVAGPSSQVTADEIFLAPEVKEFRRFSDKSDVFSFGVFLLELLRGQEATESPSPDSGQNLVEWVWYNPVQWNTVPFLALLIKDWEPVSQLKVWRSSYNDYPMPRTFKRKATCHELHSDGARSDTGERDELNNSHG
ncbi:hypothetical protein GH714_029031 [Hevea brasiliensis]|uniref:non-specific serine/threonine protein kinase n=1 Tax=Hevea brasiliensis TaxID=3981 RepID=A0A6A6LJX8_HEVBR|nr:hypothetical protein GH714_029031 [Hevea brasiliensis]